MAAIPSKMEKSVGRSAEMSLTPRGVQYRVSTPNLTAINQFPYVFKWNKPQGKSVSVSRVTATIIDPCEGDMEVNFLVDTRRESFNRVFQSLNDIVRSSDSLDNQLISSNMSDTSHVVKAYFNCTPPILLEGTNDFIEVNLNKKISNSNEAYVMCEGWIFECNETNVKDIMHSPLYTGEENSVHDAAKLMSEKEVGSVLSIDGAGEVTGVLTERDIMKKVVGQGLNPYSTLVKQVASSPVTTIEHDTSIDEAAKLMVEKHIRRLPVVEDGSIIGIVTDRDLIKAIPSIFKRGA